MVERLRQAFAVGCLFAETACAFLRTSASIVFLSLP
jgi:hypothetical protein